MRFAKTPITVGRSNDELVAASYELEDKLVKVGSITWDPEETHLQVSEGRSRRTYQWGGDAFNHLVKDLKLADMEEDDEVLLRLRGDTVVGGLTSSYYSVSNKQIIDAIQSLGLIVTIFKLHPSRSFFFARAARGSRAGSEQYYPSVCITNSETGYKRLNVRSGLLRLVCVNGLVRSIGEESVFDRLHMVKNFAEDFNLEAMIREQLRVNGLVDMIESTRTFADTSEHVDDWLKEQFGSRQRKALYSNLGYDPEVGIPGDVEQIERFALLNAVTALHNQFPRTADRWMELGGQLLDSDFRVGASAEGTDPEPIAEATTPRRAGRQRATESEAEETPSAASTPAPRARRSRQREVEVIDA